MSTNNIAKTIFFDEKTIDHYNRICNAYLNNLNLNEAKQHLDTYGIGWGEINNVLDLFSHLTLDENYRLYFYISNEYHGLYGHAAALPKDACPEPLLTAEKNRYGFRNIILPESAVPPLNVLYADGTPESYLEALYIKEIFSKMPRPYDKMQATCLYNVPSTIQDNWNVYADITDWRPRLLYKHDGATPMLISVWLHEPPNFSTLSSYSSTIELCQHHFEDSLGLHYYISQRYDQPKPYKSFINESKRYCEGRHCCEARLNRILIAEEIL